MTAPVAWLSILILGVAALEIEFIRPGIVIAGVLGCAAILVSLAKLSALALGWGSAALLAAAISASCVVWSRTQALPLLVASILLITALFLLSRTLGIAVPITAAVALTAVTLPLVRYARLARIRKTLL